MPRTAQTPAQRAQAALKALPSSIRVGAFDFALNSSWPEVEAHEDGVYADFSAAAQTIRLSTGLQSPHKVVDSFIHEINHAIWFVNDMKREEDEESVCGRFAKTWTAIFRDNPWLAGWIAEHTR